MASTPATVMPTETMNVVVFGVRPSRAARRGMDSESFFILRI